MANFDVTRKYAAIEFRTCGVCGMGFAIFEFKIYSDDDLSCNDYLVKNIIE
jgi:hypothetical protein